MKILKLISFIMILLGPVINGSVWAAAHSGVGHTVGNNHYAAGYQLSVKSQVNSGHPHVNSLQIARRGGRSFRGNRWYRSGRGFRGGSRWYRGGRWYRGNRGLRGGGRSFYKRRFYGRGLGGYYHYGLGLGYKTPYYSPYYSPYYYGW